MKNLKIAIILALFSFLLLLFSLYNAAFNNRVLETQVFYSQVNVTNVAGFDLNTSFLTFGKVPLGIGIANRNIIVSNDYSFDVVAEISCSGEICDLMDYNKTVELKKNSSQKLPFIIHAVYADEGIYDGNVTIKIMKK